LQSNSLIGLRDDKAFVLLIETFLLVAVNGKNLHKGSRCLKF